MLSVLAFHLVVVAYTAAAVLFLVDVARPGAERPLGRHAVPLLALAVALHALHLGGAVAVGLHEARSLRAALSLC
ncbi:MAG: hypothetical protein FJ104_15095, partial [Deltaproteobacteria bacterium]|nr:hypothetical protein [Deltaproteobacteria bacterium]